MISLFYGPSRFLYIYENHFSSRVNHGSIYDIHLKTFGVNLSEPFKMLNEKMFFSTKNEVKIM